jgi:hypothetical protein
LRCSARRAAARRASALSARRSWPTFQVAYANKFALRGTEAFFAHQSSADVRAARHRRGVGRRRGGDSRPSGSTCRGAPLASAGMSASVSPTLVHLPVHIERVVSQTELAMKELHLQRRRRHRERRRIDGHRRRESTAVVRARAAARWVAPAVRARCAAARTTTTRPTRCNDADAHVRAAIARQRLWRAAARGGRRVV